MASYARLYRLGITPWERYRKAAAASIAAVFDREEAERSRPLGRALDLGCGRHGGVERSPSLICPPAITPGAVTDGSVTNGAVTDGAVTDGDISDGDITLGTITYGAVTATGSGHLYVNGIALN